ncbi:alpha/beta fold hydrolase [Streptomyces sp. NBC_00388]|uniref:alpha/beta fold hydrolase n=1 Tax=Streptomyces sp. NBC_00388 TaxID=2975735 RepID=UPI002E1AB797
MNTGELQSSYRGIQMSATVQWCPTPLTDPVLVVNSLLRSQSYTQTLADGIVRWSHVMTADICGVSAPGELPAGCNLDMLADALAHLVGECGFTGVNVVGNSFTADVAHRFAVRHPGVARRAVLTGATGGLCDPAAARDLAEAVNRLDLEGSAVLDDVLHRVVCLDPSRTVLRRRALLSTLTKRMKQPTAVAEMQTWVSCLRLLDAVTAALTPALDEPPGPLLLVIVGEHDVATPPATCRALAARTPGAVFAVIKDADHFVSITRPVEHQDLIRRFLLDEPLDALPYCVQVDPSSQPMVVGS